MLIGAHVEVPRLSGLSLVALGVIARGVPCVRPSCQSQLLALTIDFLQLGQGWCPSGSPPGWTQLLGDHPSYGWDPRILKTLPNSHN